MKSTLDRLFVLVFTFVGVISINYSMFVIEYLNRWREGLFIMFCSVVMLVVSSIELHKLT
jgi:hypothetical protein